MILLQELVEVPCVKRNAMGSELLRQIWPSGRNWTSHHMKSDAVYQVGSSLPTAFRETAEGGLQLLHREDYNKRFSRKSMKYIFFDLDGDLQFRKVSRDHLSHTSLTRWGFLHLIKRLFEPYGALHSRLHSQTMFQKNLSQSCRNLSHLLQKAANSKPILTQVSKNSLIN